MAGRSPSWFRHYTEGEAVVPRGTHLTGGEVGNTDKPHIVSRGRVSVTLVHPLARVTPIAPRDTYLTEGDDGSHTGTPPLDGEACEDRVQGLLGDF